MKKYLLIIITIVWIGVIFSFSLQVADKSSLISDGVGDLILEHSSSELIEKSDTWSEIEWDFFYKIIRKCGHFAEFFVLGALMWMTMNETSFSRKQWVAVCLCILVASIDETIQLFVPGRAGMVTDVLIDSYGSAMGMFTCWMIRKCIVRREMKTC